MAELRPNRAAHWVTATAAPCTSLFKPVQVTSPVDLAPQPSDCYHPAALWWRHEELHRTARQKRNTRAGLPGTATRAGASTKQPGALGEGLREWLTSRVSSRGHGLAAAFDTRMNGPAIITGRASKGTSSALRRQGYELIAKPESFRVTKANELCPGEQDRARSWGTALAQSLSLTAESWRSG